MKAKLLPDVEELKELFVIDSSIPNGLRWKKKISNKINIGDKVGYKRADNYYNVQIFGRIYLTHRIIYSIFYNTNLLSEQIVDHFDRIKYNNNPENLRIVTRIENNRNVTKRKDTTSKYIGVCFNKQNKNFVAQIQVNKKHIYIGRFKTQEEAALAYNKYVLDNKLSHFNLNEVES